jgi:hypothetical protein
MDMVTVLQINQVRDLVVLETTSAETLIKKKPFGVTLMTLTADGNSVIQLEQTGQIKQNTGIEKSSQVTAVITEEVNS